MTKSKSASHQVTRCAEIADRIQQFGRNDYSSTFDRGFVGPSFSGVGRIPGNYGTAYAIWQWALVAVSLCFCFPVMSQADEAKQPSSKSEATAASESVKTGSSRRPNILLAISDDQSYPFASAYGTQSIYTPAFDRVARQGVLFSNAFTASPGCSPSRASILTGRYPWQNEHAGTHASKFSNKFATYPRLFQQAGYHVGSTGKGWGPGNFKDGGFKENPAGKPYSVTSSKTPDGIRATDYAASFSKFLSERDNDQPFCFWYGASEPHRSFGAGIGLAHGGQPNRVQVPTFLPDTPEVRSDLLDYEYEIEWFDSHLGRMLLELERIGELDNTIVVVTSDNGMAFPRAKANCYEFGIHMPLAISWPARAGGGRIVHDLVSLTDLMPTFLEACNIQHPGPHAMAGRSLLPILDSQRAGLVDASRTAAYSCRERHSSSRWNNLAYPQRSIRTQRYLYIRNFRPERWPAGAPRKMGRGKYPRGENEPLGPMHGGYHDIDACPTLSFMIDKATDPVLGEFLQLAVDHRPAEEMFDITTDPGCLKNLAESPSHQSMKKELAKQLESYLRETGDPRVLDGGDVFETYKRYSGIRKFPKPDWAK